MFHVCGWQLFDRNLILSHGFPAGSVMSMQSSRPLPDRLELFEQQADVLYAAV
jgi:hypothetical protein